MSSDRPGRQLTDWRRDIEERGRRHLNRAREAPRSRTSSRPSYRSCVHLEVPLRSTSSVLFLDKSLYISLVELEGRRAVQPTLYRSTLSVRFGVSSRRRSSKDSKPARINEGYGRRKEATLGRNKRNVRETESGHRRSPLSEHGAHKVEQIALTHDVNSDSDTRGHDATLGLLSLRGLSPSNTKAGRREENADEAAFSLRSNFSHRQHTFNSGQVDFRTWTKQAGSDKTEARQERGSSSEPQKVSEKTSWLKDDFLEGTSHNLSLKESNKVKTSQRAADLKPAQSADGSSNSLLCIPFDKMSIQGTIFKLLQPTCPCCFLCKPLASFHFTLLALINAISVIFCAH
ncbi:uncharacterized protein LOC130207023 isoform X2 [Pseudoliparis swirei]|uniref:uncharacterized protein LOC130207023 isoform X2 n=1 Tax=Pseudoliparis swirei TaxID=2059687 RepID=UPI0024BD7CCB|nr:uncharacterized protein LOC130207023 isoform X2 [Pseudoliparis swirei]